MLLNDIFVLKRNIGNAKKGKQYSSFGGLISGVVFPIDAKVLKEIKVNFTDNNFFRLKRKYNKTKLI